MKKEIWLKIAGKKHHSWWDIGTVTAFKTKPAVKGSEIALKISLDLPDRIFETPQYEAKIAVPAGYSKPVVDADVANNIAKVLSQQLGITVNVTAVEEESNED